MRQPKQAFIMKTNTAGWRQVQNPQLALRRRLGRWLKLRRRLRRKRRELWERGLSLMQEWLDLSSRETALYLRWVRCHGKEEKAMRRRAHEEAEREKEEVWRKYQETWGKVAKTNEAMERVGWRIARIKDNFWKYLY